MGITVGQVSSTCWWHARTLLQNKPHIRKKKLASLLGTAEKHSVTIIGKCHGPGSGVLLVLVTKTHFVGWLCEVETVVPCRVAYLRIERQFPTYSKTTEFMAATREAVETRVKEFAAVCHRPSCCIASMQCSGACSEPH